MHENVKWNSESEVLLDADDYSTNGTPYPTCRCAPSFRASRAC